jgi:hypothetical protein
MKTKNKKTPRANQTNIYASEAKFKILNSILLEI